MSRQRQSRRRTKCNFIGARRRPVVLCKSTFVAARWQIWEEEKGKEEDQTGPGRVRDRSRSGPGSDMHAMQFQLSYVDSFVRHSTHVVGRRRINASLKSVRWRRPPSLLAAATAAAAAIGNICQTTAAAALGDTGASPSSVCVRFRI